MSNCLFFLVVGISVLGSILSSEGIKDGVLYMIKIMGSPRVPGVWTGDIKEVHV